MTLAAILKRSEELDAALLELLGADLYQLYEPSPRLTASAAACSVSWDHGRGLRVLMGGPLPTPAIALMRLQYEALLRAVWLLYAASDTEVSKLSAPLTAEAEKANAKIPMLANMLNAIEGKAPAAATSMLKAFKDIQAGALNSFVHGGIHALHRQSHGYPEHLLVQVIQSSNGLLTMCSMTLAILSGDPVVAKQMSKIQPAFADCLPPLLPHAPTAP